MITWIILGIFVLIALVYIKLSHQGKRVKLIVLVLLGILFYFSLLAFFSSEDVQLTSPQGIAKATTGFFVRIGETAGELWEIGKVTGKAVVKVIDFNQSRVDGRK